MTEPPRGMVRFRDLPWEEAGPGARQKAVTVKHRRLRLLELTSGFEEEGWCHSAHWGVVVEGRMDLELPGGTATLEEGDGLALPMDPDHRHRAHVPEGERVVLFLVEPVLDEV